MSDYKINYGLRSQCINPNSADAALGIIDKIRVFYGYSDREVAKYIGFSETTLRDIRKGLITKKMANLVLFKWRSIPEIIKKRINEATQ